MTKNEFLPGLSEKYILSGIIDFLDLCKIQGVLTYRRLQVGPVPRWINKEMRFSKSKMTGMSDLVIMILGGKRTIWAEVKNAKGKLSPSQTEFKEELESLSHEYVIWRSIQDAEKTIFNNEFKEDPEGL